MPEKKKQHFVPQFYLKNFSNQNLRKTINMYNFENNLYIENVGIKQQAQKDYFYGKDNVIEDQLGELETIAARVIKNILNGDFPTPYSEEHVSLLVFTIFLIARTEFSADASDEMIDKFVKTIFKKDPVSKDIDLDQVKVKLNSAAQFSLGIVAEIIPITMDLNYALLINKTDENFIISDNPAIKYNQFLEDRKPIGGTTGFASKGLQIFLPLNPKVCLVFYDKDVYKYGNKKENFIKIDNKKDIEQINILQGVNAYKNLYFNNETNPQSISRVIEKSNKYRKREKSNVSEYSSNEYEALLHIHPEERKTNLKLSCIKELKKAKKYKVGNKVTHLRNEKLLEYVEHNRKERRGKQT